MRTVTLNTFVKEVKCCVLVTDGHVLINEYTCRISYDVLLNNAAVADMILRYIDGFIDSVYKAIGRHVLPWLSVI